MLSLCFPVHGVAVLHSTKKCALIGIKTHKRQYTHILTQEVALGQSKVAQALHIEHVPGKVVGHGNASATSAVFSKR